jgi:hypothetical protein
MDLLGFDLFGVFSSSFVVSTQGILDHSSVMEESWRGSNLFLPAFGRFRFLDEPFGDCFAYVRT